MNAIMLEVLSQLSAAFQGLEKATGSLSGEEQAAALELRTDLGQLIRRTRNLALFVGTDPAQVGEALSSSPPSSSGSSSASVSKT